MASKDEEGKKRVEKKLVESRVPDTLHYLHKKMVDKGLQRMERHPRDGLSLDPPPPKAGHGGKFTWEGPADVAENELSAPAAIDEGDPNYVDDRREAEAEAEAEGLVVGEVDVAKAAEGKEGVSRIESLIRPSAPVEVGMAEDDHAARAKNSVNLLDSLLHRFMQL